MQASSGTALERLIFNHRPWVLACCALMTVLFGSQLFGRGLGISASFEKTLPGSHPFIKNYLDNKAELRGLGDSVRVAVENPGGEIFEPEHLQVLQAINDEIILLPGVDRAWMKSIWTPVVRWTEVTEEGFVGGPVMPQGYDGSIESIEALRLNIARAGLVGSLVANDLRSSAIVVPLLTTDGEGSPLDYHRLATSLEAIRKKHELGADGSALVPVRVHIVGFAKLSGDLIDGLRKLSVFFAVAGGIAAAILFAGTRCVRSTALVLACSLMAVVWQLGAVALVGQELNPFSVLVPFLVFAIGISHGTQKLNGIQQDAAQGAPRVVAARHTFRRLFHVGVAALLANAVGFAVLTVIDIPAIRELAVSATLGVGALIVTNLVLLPVLLSYVGVSPAAARKGPCDGVGRLQSALAKLTERRGASLAVGLAAALGVAAFAISLRLQVGDLDAGSPELRADSRYNQDSAYIAAHYGSSSDVFAVIVKTPRDACGTYSNLIEADRLAWALTQLPGVQKVESLADTVRTYTAGAFDGNPKWQTVSGDQRIVDAQVSNAVSWNSDLLTPACSVIPVVAYLSDHRAATLSRVVRVASDFAALHGTAERQFLLAGGSAGVAAATNIAVERSNTVMLVLVYVAVSVLCVVAFRSWRAAVVAAVPLLLTSVMAEALMACLGIGLKVATLPVVAMGVGIGVDYALYLLSIQLAHQRGGASLTVAYGRAVFFVGRVVALVGVTLAAGVITWAWSPIKYQADMGVLLTFMFLFNMVASLVLIPALSYFLLRDVGIGRTTTPTLSQETR